MDYKKEFPSMSKHKLYHTMWDEELEMISECTIDKERIKRVLDEAIEDANNLEFTGRIALIKFDLGLEDEK